CSTVYTCRRSGLLHNTLSVLPLPVHLSIDLCCLLPHPICRPGYAVPYSDIARILSDLHRTNFRRLYNTFHLTGELVLPGRTGLFPDRVCIFAIHTVWGW